MTVAELRDKLAGLDGKTNVVIYRETDSDTQFFEIADVSLSSGVPKRDDAGRGGFTFEGSGPATCLFITVEPA